MALIFKKSTAQPAFTVAAAITGTTEATQTLTCAYTVVRARTANVTCRWYRHTADDGTDPTGVLLGTGTTYTLTGTDVGNYIRAVVTAVNPAGTVESTTSYTAIITSGDPPEPPALVTPAAITGTADVGETLSVTYSFTGQDSVAIQWYSFAAEPTGNPLTGDDQVSLGTASTQSLTETEAGRWIGVTVTATNSVDSTETSASVAMAGVDPYTPVLPNTYTVPAYDDSTLTPVYVNGGDDLQAALNNAMPGQKIVLQAGAKFSGCYDFPYGNADGSDWIYVVSSAYASLAEGVRVTLDDVANMPTIAAQEVYAISWTTVTSIVKSGTTVTVTHPSSSTARGTLYGTIELQGAAESEYNTEHAVTSASNTQFTFTVPAEWPDPTGTIQFNYKRSQTQVNNAGTLRVARGVQKVRFVGLNITTDYDKHNTAALALVHLGPYYDNLTGSGYADNIVFDRCCIHAPDTGRNRDGVNFYGITNVGVVNCHIAGYCGNAIESHALHLQSMPGPVHVENNFISAAAIPIFIGDSPLGSGTLLYPRHITIKGNYIWKDPTWLIGNPGYNGRNFLMKNGMELKAGQYVLIEGNRFENTYTQGDQQGEVMLINVVHGTPVHDIWFRNNFCYKANAVALARSASTLARVKVSNNLFFTHNKTLQYQLRASSSAIDTHNYTTITHNTMVPVVTANGFLAFNASYTFGGDKVEDLIVRDNLFSRGQYGLFGNNTASARAATDYYAEDYDFDSNAVIGLSSNSYAPEDSTAGQVWRNWYYPSNNAAVGFTNTAFTSLEHFKLLNTSPYYQAATDGTDIGADIDAILAVLNDPL